MKGAFALVFGVGKLVCTMQMRYVYTDIHIKHVQCGKLVCTVQMRYIHTNIPIIHVYNVCVLASLMYLARACCFNAILRSWAVGRIEAQTYHNLKAECLKELLQASAQRKCARLHAVVLISSHALAAWQETLSARRISRALAPYNMFRD